MNLRIITAIHNRVDMTRAFCMAMARVERDVGVKTHAAVTTPEKVKLEEGRYSLTGQNCVSLCEEFGLEYITHANKPVGDKFNAVVDSLREEDWTHLMVLGSDDIPNTRFIEHALTLDKWDFCGLDGLWFWGLNPRRAGFQEFGFFPVNKVIAGAGKVISRRAIEACDYAPWPPVNYGMDAQNMRTMRNALREKGLNYTQHRYSLKENKGFLMDVKYGMHISSMSPITRRDYFEREDPDKVLPKFLPADEVEYLFHIRQLAIDSYNERRALAGQKPI